MCLFQYVRLLAGRFQEIEIGSAAAQSYGIINVTT